MFIERVFRDLGLEVFQRGWLSSNNILFRATAGRPAALVDSGYLAHSDQTLALVESAMQGLPLELVLNTHLHSDHCGGNAALQARYGSRILVPSASLEAVRRWDEDLLSFRSTGQRCDRFDADGGIDHGQGVILGASEWRALGSPGHDPDSLMFYQPEARVLISADALWEDRLAIIFPELRGDSGFEAARSSLALIESLQPAIVIPGHGRPFTDVAAAVLRSRQRVDLFEREPSRHALYGARALTMFHMLEHRVRPTRELQSWLMGTPVFGLLHARLGPSAEPLQSFGETLVRGLVDSGQLRLMQNGDLHVGSQQDRS